MTPKICDICRLINKCRIVSAVNPDDPRAQRTRASLRAAVLDLAAERDLSAITVSAVAKRAGLNRATFYLHYPDVDALAADAMEEAVAHVARAAALCPLDAPREIGRASCRESGSSSGRA